MKASPERRAVVLAAAEFMASTLLHAGRTLNADEYSLLISVAGDAFYLADHEIRASSRLATRRAMRTIRAQEALRAMPAASAARH